MNYRHQYHAGNFADVLKHTVLLTLLEALSQKEKPWCYLDTHAGRGHYDLTSLEAQKTLEFKNGVEKIFFQTLSHTSFSPILLKYYNILELCGYPHYYPGSPLIAYHYLNDKDQMILIEKHPEEAQRLKQLFSDLLQNSVMYERLKKEFNISNQNIAIHQQDGYQSIKALLPPAIRRGLILIDPPFEQENEWDNILNALKTGLQRFSNGIYAVWYPIKTNREIVRFHQALHQLHLEYNTDDILIAELCLYPEDVAQGLKGAGMAIIHPPWQIEKTLNELLGQLFECLSINHQGRFEMKWI